MFKHQYIRIIAIILLILTSSLAAFSVISWWYFVIVLLIWLHIIALGVFNIQTGFFTQTYCHQFGDSQRKLAISFDDGPTEQTQKVLTLLEKYNAKATIFCIGKQIEKYPGTFLEIFRSGHTIGNHTFTHSNKTGFFSVCQMQDEIETTNELVEKLTGKKMLLYRPPYGVTNPNIAKAVKHTKHRVIGWNIRSLDTVIKSEDRILKRITSRLQPGSIILLHDISDKTVNVLEQLLIILNKENYQLVTVDNLLNIEPYEN